MKRGELSDDSLIHAADAYEDFETRQARRVGLRNELFKYWAATKDFHPFDREAIRLILLGRGVRVGREAA